ncbi:hypothetical protein SCHPADRAFT_938813 [Schizopora paradoxa]|uniref:Uncharacterized protein n=1 Tax=Schizopora paradoxa TaxID=27342 RepID=A0A0H2RUR6_9AGAM|nr:hypothetical protein SCHPADRAFT_938813 [Schizopora paradoxa]
MGQGEGGSGIGPTKFFQDGCISVVVPLFMLPNLKDLSIFSNSRLSFPKEDDKHFYDFEHLGIHWPTGGFGTMIPSLSTININIVEERAWKLPVVTFVGELLEKQKERGELGPCFFLIVQDDTYRFNGNGQYASQPSAQSYRGEAALEWCQEQHPHCTCGMQEMFLRQLSIFGQNHVNHT